MKHFRKVWTEDLNSWLMTTKGMKSNDAWKKFMEAFPDIKDITYAAFKNQRSRLGVTIRSANFFWSRRARPLYSEQEKKGYIRIKVAQPNIWMSKSKWVYMETHPWEDFSERSNFIFLDGDNRNFNPDNIERVSLKVMGMFNLLGGCEPGQPDITKSRVLLAKLKMATLDAGEKLGMTVKTKAGRKFREERNRLSREYQRKRWHDPEIGKRLKEHRREYFAKKRADPEWAAEERRKHNEYLKEYNKRKRQEKKHGSINL